MDNDSNLTIENSERLDRIQELSRQIIDSRQDFSYKNRQYPNSTKAMVIAASKNLARQVAELLNLGESLPNFDGSDHMYEAAGEELLIEGYLKRTSSHTHGLSGEALGKKAREIQADLESKIKEGAKKYFLNEVEKQRIYLVTGEDKRIEAHEEAEKTAISELSRDKVFATRDR